MNIADQSTTHGNPCIFPENSIVTLDMGFTWGKNDLIVIYTNLCAIYLHPVHIIYNEILSKTSDFYEFFKF
jgi:hypothetical protein